MSWFLRRLPEKTPSLSDLGLPPSSAPIIEYLTHPRAHGLILFAGAQNSGKTTFGSSLVKARLEMFGGHCVTFESPAEMPLRGKHGKAGLCIQTEVDREEDLPAAIRRAHMGIGSPEFNRRRSRQHVLQTGLSSRGGRL